MWLEGKWRRVEKENCPFELRHRVKEKTKWKKNELFQHKQFLFCLGSFYFLTFPSITRFYPESSLSFSVKIHSSSLPPTARVSVHPHSPPLPRSSSSSLPRVYSILSRWPLLYFALILLYPLLPLSFPLSPFLVPKHARTHTRTHTHIASSVQKYSPLHFWVWI